MTPLCNSFNYALARPGLVVRQDAILQRVGNPLEIAPLGNRRAGYQTCPTSVWVRIAGMNDTNLVIGKNAMSSRQLHLWHVAAYALAA
jgi:hypothetical protein